jgi:hypothetical protein
MPAIRFRRGWALHLRRHVRLGHDRLDLLLFDIGRKSA